MEITDKEEFVLLYNSYRNRLPILCAFPENRNYLLNKAKYYNLVIPKPIIFNEVLSNKLCGRDINGLLLDSSVGENIHIFTKIPSHIFLKILL